VLPIQPVGLHRGDEELRSIGVGAGVGHGEEARRAVLHQEVLIVELWPVDRLTSSAIKVLKVSSLEHEVRYDPVEDSAAVGESLGIATSCNLQEVPGGARHNLVKQLHGDPSIVLFPLSVIHLNIEENF